jgi:hypothetical protein
MFAVCDQAESWPCELNIPDIPEITLGPGAAVLSKKLNILVFMV